MIYEAPKHIAEKQGFLILSADRVVGKWESGILTIDDENLAPMYLVNTGDFIRWLELRAIDHHRANSRLLKKALRLADRDDVCTVISVNAATITDNYWIKTFDSKLAYSDVRFDNDYFARLAFHGDYGSFNRMANSNEKHTPELTNIGSFEKCWVLRRDGWWMVKSADRLQRFSEIFIYELGNYLQFNMAEYIPGNKSVMTHDFTLNGKYNFEPAYSFMGDNEDYIEVVEKLREIAPHAVRDYICMIFLDTIIANPDRHTFNFGLLRDALTGEIISLAPNFDNNMALIARGYPREISRKNDTLARYFNELLVYDPSLRKHIPQITEGDIRAVLSKIKIRIRSETVIQYVMNGINLIKRC